MMSKLALKQVVSAGLFALGVVTIDANAQWTSWTPPGSSTTYHNFGGQTGTSWTPFGSSTTYHSGSLFRGVEGGSVLFESASFAERFGEEAWLAAVESRDVQGMTQAAWSLKAIETILGKADTKTSSDAMFQAAAQVAVEQQNADALSQIVALCPACKPYTAQLQASAPTRGAGSVVSMPQVVYPGLRRTDFPSADGLKKEVNRVLESLKPWQTPYLTPDIVGFGFRGMTTFDAENVSILVNRGRQTGNASLLVQAAVELADQEGSAEFPFSDPRLILKEAAGMAVLLGDAKALALILSVCESESFGLKNPELATETAGELKLLSGSRGVSDKDSLSFLMRPDYMLIYDPAPVVTLPNLN